MRTLRWRTIVLVAGLLLLAALALLYLNFRRELDRAVERISTGSTMAQTACGAIEYATFGQGPPLLIVHGSGGGFDQGLGIGEDIARRGFRVIAVSRFGYLRTPLPEDASPQAQADAHACLLDTLGIRRAAVLGASAGAPSSMQFALRHPERSSALVLLVPLAYAGHSGAPAAPSPLLSFLFDTALRSDFLFWLAKEMAPDALIGSILATDPALVHSADTAEQARVERMLDDILPVSRRRAGLLNDGAIAGTLGRYALEDIKVPALLLSAEDDRYGTYASAEYTAKHMPDARFAGYPEGGHVWVGHHEEVLDEIAAFLKQHSG